MTIKFGILSTANIARKALIPAMLRSDQAEVVAIASSSGKANEVAKEFSISKAYENYEALLEDPEVEAVYIPLPNHLHKEWVFKSAAAGKHILCEKPAGMNAAEMEEMQEVCEKHGVKFMEAFMYQFHQQHERVKEVIASGEIGDVQLMKASFSFPLMQHQPDGNIRVDASKGGGSIYDVGCYCLHTFQNVLADQVDEVLIQGEVDDKYGVETSAEGFVKMKNGVKAMFDCGFHTYMRHEYEVVGTKGSIKVPKAYRPDAFGHEGLVIVDQGSETRTERHYSDQYQEEVKHFVDVIKNDLTPKNSYEVSIQNMRVIDACYESLKQNKAVKVNP
ncbi:Gfo/Idh/MocA family oxidoreductase [Filobacillus milosensis]|uniref:Gfo/Idh/MocA family oxidoreductase n=1 Tax=Filobacillus milosensis TaxID=94137 RepID=A0A4Y8IE52_9BACI|nr:Gfo/Idh/MocA family oxidoreductase [Filobacillus milosensis]TFB14216.1 Gfo/Idh/MocA family oxidoreductase [Filobacillus milosensis]